MSVPGSTPTPRKLWFANGLSLLDWLWLITMLVLLVLTMYAFDGSRLCAYMGTDFRGYYSSAQIALNHSFASVYDHAIQSDYQSLLSHRCMLASLPAMERVSMPYLPLFVVLFLPLSAVNFTSSYLIWVGINLAVLVIYLIHFSRALGVSPHAFRLLQWVICLPVIANLYLGQMNVFLLLCLGEFTLALLKGQRSRSGLWLGGMLIKPHSLIFLLPGLLISRNWGVIRGFFLGVLIVIGGSIAVAGLGGVRSSLALSAEFAGPLIQTAPTMMNWRALALNLLSFLPSWFSWTVAIVGMGVVLALVIVLWLKRFGRSEAGIVLLILATYAGTLTVAWHSHFYLLMPLIPLLMYLDGKGMLPLSVLSAWLLGPPVWYMLVFLLDPSLARNWFGIGMLVLSLFLLTWSAYQLLKCPVAELNCNHTEQEFQGVRDV